MAKPQKPTAAMKRENTIRIRLVGDQIIKVVAIVGRAIPWIACPWATVEAARAFAGKVTFADIDVNATASIAGCDVNVVLLYAAAASIAFGFFGVKLYYRERMLKKQTVARLEGRVHEREIGIDPDRTTSSLTNRGDTNPEDL
ncbi:MAG: hypothetical protein R8K46_08585 [Mariprofundaceae bacterium]